MVIIKYKAFISNFLLYFRNKFLWLYILKFAIIFCLCYYGTLAVIGLSAPGNLYSEFVHHYLNYVSWLRTALLYSSKCLLNFFSCKAYIANGYLLKVRDGQGLRVVYSCLGFGIMSFWVAFITANKGSIVKKIKWILGGLFLIFVINVTRLFLLVIATNKHWPFPFFDHHMWFNITAYIFIFLLIYFYDKSENIHKTILHKK